MASVPLNSSIVTDVKNIMGRKKRTKKKSHIFHSLWQTLISNEEFIMEYFL